MIAALSALCSALSAIISGLLPCIQWLFDSFSGFWLWPCTLHPAALVSGLVDYAAPPWPPSVRSSRPATATGYKTWSDMFVLEVPIIVVGVRWQDVDERFFPQTASCSDGFTSGAISWPAGHSHRRDLVCLVRCSQDANLCGRSLQRAPLLATMRSGSD